MSNEPLGIWRVAGSSERFAPNLKEVVSFRVIKRGPPGNFPFRFLFCVLCAFLRLSPLFYLCAFASLREIFCALVAASPRCVLLRPFDFFSYLGAVTPRTVGHMPFDLQPILNCQLVQLRPLRTDDYEVLYAVAADPLIWEQHSLRDRFEEEVFQQFYRHALESRRTLIILHTKDRLLHHS